MKIASIFLSFITVIILFNFKDSVSCSIFIAGPINQTINGSIYYPSFDLNNLFALISSNSSHSSCFIYLEDNGSPYNLTGDYSLMNQNLTLK